jgi:hypothetical protein
MANAVRAAVETNALSRIIEIGIGSLLLLESLVTPPHAGLRRFAINLILLGSLLSPAPPPG